LASTRSPLILFRGRKKNYVDVCGGWFFLWKAKLAWRLDGNGKCTCSLPVDDTDLVLLSGLNFASPSEEITWLSYHVQYVKLILAAHAVHVAFYNKCADVLTANDGKSFYSDAQSLKIIARYLSQSLQCIQSWLRNVPDALKARRKGDGESFSTDRSPLEIDAFAPLWLQRQRLLLELLYHNLVMCLYRPFIYSLPLRAPAHL